jgi:Cof subfamily protein (haloacid dehalogenase superfamily)
MYRLLALDIDGTIRSIERPVSDRTQRAIRSVVDAGVTVTLATGRMFASARKASSELGLTTPIVCFQGARVVDPVSGAVLWHRPLTRDMTGAALDALGSWDVEVVAYHDDEIHVAEMTPWVEAYVGRNQVPVNVVGDRAGLAGGGHTRLLAVGDEDEVQRLEAHLRAAFDSTLYVTRSLPHFCEILHPDGGKDKALSWLCDRLGLDAGDTVAFGNGYNDVQMVAWAGLGVAVGDAVPEVLEVADLVAPPFEEDGAARVLEQLLEEGRFG